MAMAEPGNNLDDNIGRLTQRERECLRLVAQLMTSKQIALQLGISKHTVDERIESARRRIGARGRNEAARLLAAHEGGALYPPIVSGPDSIGLADSNDPATLAKAPGERGYVAATSVEASPSHGRPTDGGSGAAETQPAATRALPLSGWSLDRGRLGVGGRLGAVLLMAVLSALAFGGILSGLDALRRLN